MAYKMASVLSLLLLLVAVAEGKRVMPWFCLERCGGNSTTIASNLQEAQEHASELSAAAFESYNLGPNGTLVKNFRPFGSLTPVSSSLQSYSLETLPMISSYPYPPQFIDWMRQLFDPTTGAADNFFQQAIAEIVTYNYTGFNVDWEPSDPDSPITPEDAANYAKFLDKFAKFVHALGPSKKLTVDVASWSPIWNWTLIAQTDVDTVMLMDTYTNNFTHFQTHLNSAIDAIGVEKLGVGLSTMDLSTNKVMNYTEVEKRFQVLVSSGIKEIDVWLMPIPDFWWPLVDKFLGS